MVILIICSTPHYVSTTSKFLSLWLKFFSFGGRLNKCGLEIVRTHQSHTLDTFPHWRKIPCGLKWKGVKKYCLLKSYFYFDATMKNWKICHQNRSRDAGSLPRSHSKNYSFEKYMGSWIDPTSQIHPLEPTWEDPFLRLHSTYESIIS